jgi:SAM-dependent methyltransferase
VEDKKALREFWNDASCGERLLLASTDREGFEQQARERYRLEPFIEPFLEPARWKNLKVLEIGVGLGADHQLLVEAGAKTSGIDLTPRAIEMCRIRLAAFGLGSDLSIGDAEQLPFDAETFDLVWSWGVIHHSPDTEAAVNEIRRVLKPGGVAKIMIYHTWSLVGLMLWLRYGLMRCRPWMTLGEVYSRYLESPGTKAYSLPQARELFREFSHVRIRTVLTHGDLLSSNAGQRHGGVFLSVARRIWPRRYIEKFLPNAGLFMMIEATKPVV